MFITKVLKKKAVLISRKISKMTKREKKEVLSSGKGKNSIKKFEVVKKVFLRISKNSAVIALKKKCFYLYLPIMLILKPNLLFFRFYTFKTPMVFTESDLYSLFEQCL